MSQSIPTIPPGTAADDLITTINDRIRRINNAFAGTSASPAAAATKPLAQTAGAAAPLTEISYGTHRQRLAVPLATLVEGVTWYETDRTVWYQFQAGGSSAGTWKYIGGSYSCTQSVLPTDLGVADAGFLAAVTDYNHVLAWSGSGWSAGPNWDAPGYIRGFMVDPSPTTGWKLCDGLGDDGSAIGVSHPVTYLKSDGTLGSITSATVAPCIPNLVGSPSFLQFGAVAAGVTSAVAPTLTMNSYTPTGTVSQPTFTGSLASTSAVSAGTPAGTVSQPTFSGGTTGFGTTNFTVNAGGSPAHVTPASITASGTVTQPTFTGSAMGTHSHTVTATGTVSQPTFTGNAATLTGSVSATGLPPAVTLRPWFRK